MSLTPELYELIIKIIDERVKDIKVTREEFEDLKKVIKELSQALTQLTKRVDELAEAQKRTEDVLAQLTKQVGRLSDTIGFGLEDIARVMLPGWFERHMGIDIEELEPKYILVDGEEIQINLFGIGEKDGSEVVIVGECKSRIYGRDVESFSRIVDKVRRYFKDKEVIGVLFGYLIHPSAQKEAEKRGLKVVATYMR